MRPVPRPVAVALTLSLLAALFGFLLGGVLGLAEPPIKKHLDDAGTAALQTAYKGDVAAKDAVVKKSWEYLKRAHLHGGAIGAVALGCVLTLVLFCRPGRLATASASALGAGAVLYPIFWLVAGLSAPGLGGTGAAKESLSFIAIPGAGLSILGLCGTIAAVARDVLFATPEEFPGR